MSDRDVRHTQLVEQSLAGVRDGTNQTLKTIKRRLAKGESLESIYEASVPRTCVVLEDLVKKYTLDNMIIVVAEQINYLLIRLAQAEKKLRETSNPI